MALEIEIKCILKNNEIIKQEIIWQAKYWRWWQKQKHLQIFLSEKMGVGRQTIKDRKGKGRKSTWFTKEKEDDWIRILGLENRTQLGKSCRADKNECQNAN